MNNIAKLACPMQYQ